MDTIASSMDSTATNVVGAALGGIFGIISAIILLLCVIVIVGIMLFRRNKGMFVYSIIITLF